MPLDLSNIKQTILLVHAMSPSKKFILERIKEMGLHIVCLSKEKTEYALPFVDEWILADLQNHEECVEMVVQYSQRKGVSAIGGVVTFWDEAIFLTSKISDKLSLIGVPFEVSQIAKNKYDFRDFCSNNGIAAPRNRMLHKKEDIFDIEKYFTYPMVIKPVYGACSAYVVRVENQEELLQTYDYIVKNIKSFWLAPEWENLDLLVEEYVGGAEVDIDMLVQDGVICYASINDNNQTNEPYFVETGWSGPSILSQERQDNLIEMSKKTLEAMGAKNCCVHFEAKSTDSGQAVPIEINLRMGGGEAFLFSKNIWGVDMVENIVKIALGIPLKINKANEPLAHVASHRFLSQTSCEIKNISINDLLYEKKYLIQIYFEKQSGDIFKAPPDGYDRLIGVVTVSGVNHEDVNRNLEDALKLITIEMKPL